MQVQQIKANSNKVQSFGFRGVDTSSLAKSERAFLDRIKPDLLEIGDNITEAVLTSDGHGGIVAGGVRGLKPFAEQLRVWSSLDAPNLQKIENDSEKRIGYIDLLKDLALSVQTKALEEYERLSTGLISQ